MYCRHCTRRRFAGQNDAGMPQDRIDQAIEYIRNTPQIRDVLLSGGDALLCSDERLEYIISKLREIPHVEIVRIGSRTPVVMPQRITPELCAMLKKYHPVWLNTHFNHPNEITPESAAACARLADAGVPLGNQSVLLAGVNDCVHVMKKLVHELVKIRVRPYYIYQCDLSMGLEHFRTGPHLRLLRAHLRGGRPGRRRQDPCYAPVHRLPVPPQNHSAQLRGRHHHLHRAGPLRGELPVRDLQGGAGW